MLVFMDKPFAYCGKVCKLLWKNGLHFVTMYVSSCGQLACGLWQSMLALVDRLLAYFGKVCQFFWTDCLHTEVKYVNSLDRLLAYFGKVC